MDRTDVHVLNVGAGSCTVVHPPSGHLTMIDVNDGGEQRDYEETKSQRPLTDPIDWFIEKFGLKMFRFILSHPDADHMAGLRRVLMVLDVINFWDLPHDRTRQKSDFRVDESYTDWVLYRALRAGVPVEDIIFPKRIEPLRGETGKFWTADDIEVLSPDHELVAEADAKDVYNDASYVLRFRHGDTSSVLLASDIEEKAWLDMIDAGIDLRSNVLIASHHGRKTGFCEEAMELIRPETVVVSTAQLPKEHDAIPDYRRYAKKVLSTRVDGDISIRMWDDGDIDFYNADGLVLYQLSDPS